MSDKAIYNKGAVIDPTGIYRYSLWRIWDVKLPVILFIMINPSTADTHEDDPTIRRCVGFAKKWGYGALEVRNLFAYRATDPRELKFCSDPVGPENNRHILESAEVAHKIVVAWGTKGSYKGRDREVIDLIAKYKPVSLDITAGGHPKHPLYIASNQQPLAYPREAIS
ncbi:DUF1643 domain-containing protein [Fontibacillus panacisegetis]|nr:DUF1643 domain-containing protein [Fontibacillus panacisegetis]